MCDLKETNLAFTSQILLLLTYVLSTLVTINELFMFSVPHHFEGNTIYVIHNCLITHIN